MPSRELHYSKNHISRRGRPKSENPLVFVTVGLTAAQWSWLRLWFPTGSPTAQLSALLDRALKFWPLGPYKFGHKPTSRARALEGASPLGTVLEVGQNNCCNIATVIDPVRVIVSPELTDICVSTGQNKSDWKSI